MVDMSRTVSLGCVRGHVRSKARGREPRKEVTVIGKLKEALMVAYNHCPSVCCVL